jgi:hypothetical protein
LAGSKNAFASWVETSAFATDAIILENGPQGISRAMNSFDLKDDLLFDHSQLLLSKDVLLNPSPARGKPSISCLGTRRLSGSIQPRESGLCHSISRKSQNSHKQAVQSQFEDQFPLEFPRQTFSSPPDWTKLKGTIGVASRTDATNQGLMANACVHRVV